MKTICVVTGSRAEYGLLRPLIDKFHKSKNSILKLIVTGMHLKKEFGLTYQEIEKDGYPIDKKIEILNDMESLPDSKLAMARSMSLALNQFTEYFLELKPDILVVLGDRYEIFAAATAAYICHIPIAHIHGGETTEGAEDEFFRHGITKMSYLHFTSCEAYRKRVIQLGESPDRVYNVGALGVENVLELKLLSKSALEKEIGYSLRKPYGIITFHPATLDKEPAVVQFEELLKAITSMKEKMNFIFTKSNADTEGLVINQLIDEYCEKNGHAISFTSLGVLRYLSTMKYAALVMGNSSSGIIEAPSFGIPVINIGDRQKGRIQAGNILNCRPERQEIEKALERAVSPEFIQTAKSSKNPYGNGFVSGKIMEIMENHLDKNDMDIKKNFYDIEFEVNKNEE